jgi:phage terminase, small subunit, putative, P27 family
MPAGRPPKPTALKLLHGDDKKNPQRINRSEPVPADDVVRPTVDLADEAQAAWDRLAPDLMRKGVLTAWDAQAFTVYCQTVAHYNAASRMLELEGMTARGAAGGVIKSPFWQIMRDAVATMTTIGGQFGLSPSERSKLSLGEASRAPGADLLSG